MNILLATPTFILIANDGNNIIETCLKTVCTKLTQKKKMEEKAYVFL